MKTSLNIGLLRSDISLEQALSETARAGFAGIELVVSTEGRLTFQCTEAQCIEIGRRITDAGLEITGLSVEDAPAMNLASPDPELRTTAKERAIASLDRANWLGAGAISLVAGVVGGGRSLGPTSRYEDAYAFALEALFAIRFEAEQRGVVVACRCCRGGFLLSPFEARDFFDHVNSAWVGACLDVADTMAVGCPVDWIRTMGHRVIRIQFCDVRPGSPAPGARCSLGEGDVPWEEVVAALREVQYAGPATYAGSGDIADAGARLTRLLGSRG